MHRTTTSRQVQPPPAPAAPSDGLPVAETAFELPLPEAQLRREMADRAVIDQARGMVMVLAPCPRGQAWKVLVDVSQHCNIKLRDVACALVATTDGERLPSALRHALHHALVRQRAAQRA
ncbi:ANTAR domain-containing protein [Streptomyces sp. NPDC001828]|uniref:ANTAR domain-containing protein n=1 Tax=Streptomyces sp. NPDC001828 TaxID=3364615 RepID=UPI003677C403